MAASTPYWKNYVVRGSPKYVKRPAALPRLHCYCPPTRLPLRYPNLNRWFEAFEQRPAYVASKSDWYTHIKDIPPQYGAGVGIPAAKATAQAMDGGDASWRLPLPPLASSDAPSDVLQPGWEAFEADAPVEAAHRVSQNHAAIARFMARGAGRGGGWSVGRPDRSALADPYAKPNEDVVATIDAVLAVAVCVLLDGADPADAHAEALADAVGDAPKQDVAKCLRYLRDRVGVPRDMSYPAARCLRGTLNWAEGAL